MKILVLDDDEKRHKVFAKRLDGNHVIHVYNTIGAIKAISSMTFDLAFLDHDLGEYRDDGSGETREYTGKDVCEFIASLDECRRPRRVIVHSWNSYGAHEMCSILRACGLNDVHKDPFSFLG